MANAEHLKLLQEGVPAWNVWRQAHADIRPDLHDAVLSGLDLRGANLAGADLGGANLAKANLVAANLAEADLRGADLRGTNLSRTNLSGVKVQTCNFFIQLLGKTINIDLIIVFPEINLCKGLIAERVTHNK